jgi:pectinesterase
MAGFKKLNMKRISFIFLLLAGLFAHAQQVTKTVAADGSGDYKTVQAAFDAIPYNNKKPITIVIGEGIYKEKLLLDSTKNFVTVIGANKFTSIPEHRGVLKYWRIILQPAI